MEQNKRPAGRFFMGFQAAAPVNKALTAIVIIAKEVFNAG
jgi:hypothetical protein